MSRTSHQDGSEWVITHTYDADGRLAKVVGGKLGEPVLESLYAYDAAGRPLRITNHPREGARTDFRYDAEGRKTAIQTFEPETLLGLQNTAFVGSAWDAIQMGFGVPVGGKVTTTYNRPASSGGDTRR